MKYDDRHTTTLEADPPAPPSRNGKSQPIVAAPKSPRHRWLPAVAALAVAGGAWTLHDWWTTGRFIESTDDAFVGADISTIASKVPGFVVQVAVTDNQPVQAGDLLAVIDSRDYLSLIHI